MKCKKCQHYMVVELSIPSKNKPEQEQRCLTAKEELREVVLENNYLKSELLELKERKPWYKRIFKK